MRFFFKLKQYDVVNNLMKIVLNVILFWIYFSIVFVLGVGLIWYPYHYFPAVAHFIGNGN